MKTMTKLLLFMLLALFGCTISTEDEESTMNRPIEGGNVQGGGWSQSGKLITNNREQKVTLQAQFPKSDVYTVQFGIGRVPVFSARTVAEITWSVAGNRVTRRMTPNSGGSISGRAEAVEVKLIDVTDAFNAGQEYDASILVSPGVRASTANPPTLIDPFDGVIVAPASTQSVPIPQGVGVVSALVVQKVALGAPIPAGEISVEQFDGVTSLLIYDARDYTGFVPIVASADSLVLGNFNAVTAVRFSIIWGIDG
jgi:hypothetical protein